MIRIFANKHNTNASKYPSVWQMIDLCDDFPIVMDYHGNHVFEYIGPIIETVDGRRLAEHINTRDIDASAWSADERGNCIIYADLELLDCAEEDGDLGYAIE